MITDEKAKGRFYTPSFIVRNILDLAGYGGAAVLGRHVIDNSCGDGAFVCEAVNRYCKAAVAARMAKSRLRTELARYIHGIEIDDTECEKCRAAVTAVAALYGVSGVKWDIVCGDALTLVLADDRYSGKMDYVVGNPPYVRVHNLLDSYAAVKGFSFAQSGMTDLLIVFYEIGLKMLAENGILGYITPSSYYNSVAGEAMRKHLIYNHSIKAVVDLKHFQPFEATTYTAITILTKQSGSDTVLYFEYDKDRRVPVKIAELTYGDFYVNGDFYFGSRHDLDKFRHVLSLSDVVSACSVKNGFATLCDSFFIGDLPFDEYTIPIIKASTGRLTKCLFPYDAKGKIIPLETLSQNRKIKSYYENNADRLKSRSLDKKGEWHGFGRSQGIGDVHRNKYAVNTLIRDVGDIKLRRSDAGSGVYSGLYILTELSFYDLSAILFTDDFAAYVAMLGKYKSGGYYTFSSKNIQNYLNYKLSERIGSTKRVLRYEKLNTSSAAGQRVMRVPLRMVIR